MAEFKRIKILSPADVAARNLSQRQAEVREQRRQKQSAELDEVLSRPVTLEDAPKRVDPVLPPAKLTLYNDGTRPGTFKVWSIWRVGDTLTTEWGPDGGTLQRNSNKFSSPFVAEAERVKIVNSKRKKGYREVR